MDFTRYSVRAKYPNGSDVKKHDTTTGRRKIQLLGSTMSRSTYANIESGRRNIKVSDLKALQIVFDVDFSEFFKD